MRLFLFSECFIALTSTAVGCNSSSTGIKSQLPYSRPCRRRLESSQLFLLRVSRRCQSKSRFRAGC